MLHPLPLMPPQTPRRAGDDDGGGGDGGDDDGDGRISGAHPGPGGHAPRDKISRSGQTPPHSDIGNI